MRAVGLRGCRPALLGAQQRHLGAHLRAVRSEEGEQRVAAGVAARGAVRPHQRLGEVGPARLVELHERERQVGRDVDPAQRRVELDAVDDVDALAEQDVLEPQVAVAVAHESRGGARIELVPERSQLCAGYSPSSSRNTPSSTKISSPPGCTWGWNRVCGAQRTSEVSMPSHACSGITDSPGATPGRHGAVRVSSRTCSKPRPCSSPKTSRCRPARA